MYVCGYLAGVVWASCVGKLYCVCCSVMCCVTLRFEDKVYKSQGIELMICVNVDEENIVWPFRLWDRSSGRR